MALSSRPPIQRRQSLYEQVYSALRTGILTGELVSGSRLIETQLTEWLNVSRTPLREALRQLQKEGLITADTNGGVRVITISATDAAELYDCRLALEQLSVVGACNHVTDAQLTALEGYVVQAEAQDLHAVEIETLLQLLDLDYQFHRLIAESSGNRRLVSLLNQMFDAMALLRIQTLQQNPSVLDIRLEHRQIYEAIAQRDAAAATAAVRFHLLASKDRVVQEIQATLTAPDPLIR